MADRAHASPLKLSAELRPVKSNFLGLVLSTWYWLRDSPTSTVRGVDTRGRLRLIVEARTSPLRLDLRICRVEPLLGGIEHTECAEILREGL